ncbi:MAG: NAD(P)/FAD-dependent oxidoreductase [Pseudomonadota bacterium]
MTRDVDVLVVGGGQSGLAMSHLLSQRSIDHLVLERGEAANSWRNERWDSLHLVIPNKYWRMPGMAYDGDQPDAFMSKHQVVARFERYVAQVRPPLLAGANVVRATQREDGGFTVATSDEQFACRHLVVASGPFQAPATPAWAAQIDGSVAQIASQNYRNPAQVPPGKVVVVGTGQSGVQIAEELLRAGREVHVCLGPRGWISRRYLGRDITDWYHDMGVFDVTLEQFPSMKEARAGGFSQLAGDAARGHDTNLHTLHALGATLLGRVVDGDASRLQLQDASACMAAADAFAVKARGMVDGYVKAKGVNVDTGEDPWPTYTGTSLDERTALDFRKDGIGAIVWANGFRPDYRWLQVPVFDTTGFPLHRRGVTAVRGLYFLGLEWQHRRKSSTLMAGDEDASHLLSHISSAP